MPRCPAIATAPTLSKTLAKRTHVLLNDLGISIEERDTFLKSIPPCPSGSPLINNLSLSSSDIMLS